MKKKKYIDPYSADEAKKYSHPVPSRKFLLEFLEEIGVPIGLKAILNKLEIDKEYEKEGLKRRLKAMVRDAQLMRDRKNRYCLIDKLELVCGTIEGHADGYGFLLSENAEEDYYISPVQMRYVIHGDRVLAKIVFSKNGKLEARIRKVIKRTTEVIGKVEKNSSLTYVKPLNVSIAHNIFLSNEDIKNVSEGALVIVKLISHPFDSPQVLGQVIHVLGNYMDPGLEVDIIIHNNQIPNVWEDNVLEEAKKLAEIPVNDEWENLSHMPFITIDGEDAKDLDDAVFCEEAEEGWTLYVAIAHVSHYVKPNSYVDIEAKERGNSTYFPNRVVPMLPSILSNDLCSLNPNENKATLVCKMTITKDGILKRAKFIEAIIRSRAQLTYQNVAKFYENDTNVSFEKEVKCNLMNLHALYHALLNQRQLRNALDLDIPETKIIFSEEQKIKKIIRSKRTIAHKIIEECMLIANVAAANLLDQNELPSLFRNHIKPNSETLNELSNQLSIIGVKLAKGLITNEDFMGALQQIKARPDSESLQMLILHAMERANYTAECLGHFGLAMEKYTHFTSPIRRYPDLIVHRSICSFINKQGSYLNREQLQKIGEHCSMTERRSESAERELISWLKCEYMLDHVGNQYSGTISGITDFGLFVTLDEYYIDGLVHVTSLQDDYYRYDQRKLKLIGKRTGTKYQFGETIDVVVASVDLNKRRIDFTLA